ncbi:DUF411 domain-containing protein [Candidatus Palauibacter sp.]|uniref:DUF411 domain-containing protein n=1 Tax=Candidatus Palauibacter sp. TaxID=3101350 RepID=UPI003C6F406C
MFEKMFRGMFAAAVPCVVLGTVLIVTGCAPEAAAEYAEKAENTVVADGGAGDATLAAAIADAPTIKVYKSPTCGCCALWVDHMREAGFELDVEDTDDMVGVKVDAGLPLQLQSCHTALVGDYVFEGHIPAEVIARFLAEAPSARGLAVPGMPVGSPGMEFGNRVDPYDVIQFDAEGKTSVYERR